MGNCIPTRALLNANEHYFLPSSGQEEIEEVPSPSPPSSRVQTALVDSENLPCEQEPSSVDLDQRRQSREFIAQLGCNIQPAQQSTPTDKRYLRRQRFQSSERIFRSSTNRGRHRSGSPKERKSSAEKRTLSLQKELIKELTSLQESIGEPLARSTPRKHWKMAAAEVKTSIKKVNKPIESEVSQDSGLCVSLQNASKPFESTGEELKEHIKYPSQLLESSSASEIAANIADSSISGERQGRRRNYLTNWNCSRSLRIRKPNAKTDLSASAVIEEETHSVRLKRSGGMRRDKALGNGLGGEEENMAKGSEDDLARLFWRAVDRRGAEACLARNYYPEGAFLLRPSSEPNVIALSLKTAKQGKRNVIVKHFRIKFDPQCQHYYLSKSSVYSSLSDFIRCHEVSAGGLPCRLVPSSADGVVIGFPPQSAPPHQQDLTPDFHIHRNSLVLRRRIGCGSFGEVWLAYWPAQGYVAAKRMLGNEQLNRQRFLQEAEIMCRLKHPHIVRLLGVCSAETTTSVSDAVGCVPTYIVTELMAYGSLKTFVQRRKAQPLVYEQLIDFMVQVSDGMSYLERQNYIHRDLRASNVLVGGNLTLKVADFGLAHILGDDTEYLGNVDTKFPIRWTAPEGITRQVYSTKSDVWSFGILMYEIVTCCEQPYNGMSSREVQQRVPCGYQLPRPYLRLGGTPDSEADSRTGLCPLPLYNLMLQCWEFTRENRPTFRYLNQTLSAWISDDSSSECGSSRV